MVKFEEGTIKFVVKALPLILWHSSQWHTAWRAGGPVKVYFTDEQRQDPAVVAIIEKD